MEIQKYNFAIGRRKTSVASVRLFSEKGLSTVNGITLDKLMVTKRLKNEVISPFTLLELNDKAYFTAKVNGGGSTSQIEAIVQGLARALVKMNESYKLALRKAGMLTRDSRMVERKKIGLKKARKGPSFSKR
ncbi:MAG: 30S ribosomal protein S9 [bacterium]